MGTKAKRGADFIVYAEQSAPKRQKMTPSGDEEPPLMPRQSFSEEAAEEFETFEDNSQDEGYGNFAE